MGAQNIELEINKKATRHEIEAAFKRQQSEDKSCNGHQEGYSGDFQTVSQVLDHTHKIFDSYDEAQNYCLKNAEKWTSVVAVYYRSAKFVPSTKVTKLSEKLTDLNWRFTELMKTPFKMRSFQRCEGCQSQINTSKMHGHKCPVCLEGDFRPLSHQGLRYLLKLRLQRL